MNALSEHQIGYRSDASGNSNAPDVLRTDSAKLAALLADRHFLP